MIFGLILFAVQSSSIIVSYKPVSYTHLDVYKRQAKPGIELTTIDASASVQNYAKTYHQALGLKNITYINAQFDDALPKLLNDFPRLDVVYIDGNHTYEATLRYFNLLLPKCTANTVLIFDDIYWS